jgi:Tol biopolymer transport system component
VHDSTSTGFEIDDVTTVAPDGSDPKSLFGFLAWKVEGADYSADGDSIIFTYERNVGGPRLDMASADGTNRRAIDGSTNLSMIGRPSWSPDDSTIVFSGRSDLETDNLYTILPGGSDPVPLLTGLPWDQAPDWGPKP